MSLYDKSSFGLIYILHIVNDFLRPITNACACRGVVNGACRQEDALLTSQAITRSWMVCGRKTVYGVTMWWMGYSVSNNSLMKETFGRIVFYKVNEITVVRSVTTAIPLNNCHLIGEVNRRVLIVFYAYFIIRISVILGYSKFWLQALASSRLQLLQPRWW